MVDDKFYLSSLDSKRFEAVRECRVLKTLIFDTGKSAVVTRIEPPVVGRDFNRGADLQTVVLVPRHEGVSIGPISEFPCFVFIAIEREVYRLESLIRSDELEIVGCGEIYRTYGDAENYVFV